MEQKLKSTRSLSGNSWTSSLPTSTHHLLVSLAVLLSQYLLYLIHQVLCLLHGNILHGQLQSSHTSLIGTKYLKEKYTGLRTKNRQRKLLSRPVIQAGLSEKH